MLSLPFEELPADRASLAPGVTHHYGTKAPMTDKKPATKHKLATDAGSPAEQPPKAIKKRPKVLAEQAESFDFLKGAEAIPQRVRDMINAHLAMDAEDAKESGNLGFMARALAMATLPHQSRVEPFYRRVNGDYTLTMMTAHPNGLPYGRLARILTIWVTTEVARTKNNEIFLGERLSDYLRELDLLSGGGKRGNNTRLRDQMASLFSSVINCSYSGISASGERKQWGLRNVMIANDFDWWEPQDQSQAGTWHSRVLITDAFAKECIDNPIPVDWRAIKPLRSPLAIDLYVFLTHRFSYLRRKTTIPWISLMNQFGSDYARNPQGIRDFRRAVERELKNVMYLYTQARVEVTLDGLVLYPSQTHIPKSSQGIQADLWGLPGEKK